MIRHRLDDSNWDKIYTCLRNIPGIYTGNEEKCRQFVDGVHWILRTGTPWRDLPNESGAWNSVYKRFSCWSDKGVWDNVHQQLIQEPDMEWLLIDSTVVRAHACAAGAPKNSGGQKEQALGKSVGGFRPLMHWETLSDYR